MKTAANYWGHRPSSGSAWQAGSPCSFRVGSVFMGSSRGGRAGRVLLTTGVFPVTCGFRRMAALVVPRPGFTGRGRFSGVRGLVLCWTRPRGCVWLWGRARRSRSRGRVCGVAVGYSNSWVGSGSDPRARTTPHRTGWFREVPHIGA